MTHYPTKSVELTLTPFKTATHDPLVDWQCLIELPTGLSAEQKKWYCVFQRLFREAANDQISFLKGCKCFDEKHWSDNLKHALHKTLNENCKAYSDAFHRIQTAADRGLRQLVFRYMALTRIPTNIGNCGETLQTLVLQELEIHGLPQSMSKLKRLQNLTVSKCPLYELPAWIGELTSLTKLTVARCRIRMLPTTLRDGCRNLQHLDLKYNFLSDAAFDHGRLLQFDLLQDLDVEGNPVTAVLRSTSEARLPLLVTLNLNFTLVKSIAPQLASRLISLSWVGVSGIEAPPQVSPSLRYLHMAGSSFRNGQQVAKAVFDLPMLEYVNVPFAGFLSDEERKRYRKQGKTVVTCKSSSCQL